MKKLILTIFITLFSILASWGQNIAELKQKAEQGDALAQFVLGYRYKKGDGVEKDLREAIKWYRKSAEQGVAIAQFTLGYCYAYGEGVEKDLREAVKWYRKSAEQGYADAQYNLALCYKKGEGVEKDLREAVKWYRKAAEQGDALAQFNLGYSYNNGEGVEKDLREAVKWYRKSAEQGDAEAQLALGVCYVIGEGVIQNNVKAYAWFALASANGSEEARKGMDMLRKEMSASQIQYALKLAENYEKGIFDETPKKENSTKTGSGFAITSNGFIITNYHVVADSTKVKVIKNGIEYSATVVASDTSNDIAILKISQATKPLSLITSRKVKIGNNVYSMGFPNVHTTLSNKSFSNDGQTIPIEFATFVFIFLIKLVVCFIEVSANDSVFFSVAPLVFST